VGANRAALNLLRMSAKGIGATQLPSVLDISLEDLLVRHRRRPSQSVQVQTQDGSKLFAHVYAEHLAIPATSNPRAHGPVDVDRDALANLDTGDLKWRTAADKVRRVMDKPIPVLIQGESGVGKEYFARATHESSKRRDGPFVAINCAGIPESLMEAELFGYASGAFTGARKEGNLGRIREANGGTLFLDEIGDMPLSMQTRLLRVLQERSITPLGGGRSVDVDFSLLCATHCNLREAIDQGKFRSDLYYRINGLTVLLPALRERSDFSALAEQMLKIVNADRNVGIVPELLAKLQRHPWPGNLRQLASVLRTGSAMLDDDEHYIELRHLPEDIQEQLFAVDAVLPARDATPEPSNLKELSKYAIERTLESTRGNISRAARTLGISRQTLYRKLKH